MFGRRVWREARLGDSAKFFLERRWNLRRCRARVLETSVTTCARRLTSAPPARSRIECTLRSIKLQFQRPSCQTLREVYRPLSFGRLKHRYAFGQRRLRFLQGKLTIFLLLFVFRNRSIFELIVRLRFRAKASRRSSKNRSQLVIYRFMVRQDAKRVNNRRFGVRRFRSEQD